MLIPMLLALALTSPDVHDGTAVAKPFVWNADGCEGANHTPRVTWDVPPPGTWSLALTVIDHDAPKPGGWVHWRVTHIPANAHSAGPVLPLGAVSGKNDFGTTGWGGPCPPPGPLHHYTFTLDALDARGKVLTSARIVPVYKR